MHGACTKCWNLRICSRKCSVRVWKSRSGSFSKVCEREHASAKLQDQQSFRISAPSINMFCVRGKVWLSPMIVHLPNHIQGKRDVFKRSRHNTMRSSLSSLKTRKVTLAWTLKFAVLLWNDWTGRQLSMIGKSLSQLCRICKGGTQCRIALWFSGKIGYLVINVVIWLLMCSLKLCCVPSFRDFGSWKCNFGVGMYVKIIDLF